MLISLIVPCYNESAALPIFYKELCKVTGELDKYDFEFLFSESISFGKLLIYGIRFADGFIIPERLKEKYTIIANKEIKNERDKLHNLVIETIINCIFWLIN